MNCLDAETLATWMDGGLTNAALEDVRAHVADCERCQALVGAIGRTRAAIPASEPQRAPRRWLMWGVPLAAAATAIAVWVAIPQQRNAAVVAPAVPREKQERAVPEPPAAPTPESRSANTAASPSPSGQRSDDIAQLAPDAVITESAPPPLAPPAAAAPKAVAGQSAPRAEALARDAAGLCGPAPPPGAAGQLIATSAAGGVCWAVGRAGLVLRSIDGRIWERINFPEMTDLSSVRATDASTASMSTADGRTFSTANGGQTWLVR